ncbi:protein AE7-like 1 isoform X2 [Phragmites australis]|uniref:protein AE7-like 1 isoform X2 n=1 Tax=Phragmites australis TaxID=29695 RepID=UPI002D794B14|nr:protein AE7-like 1 isoform X2 [Phragmites australis]
MTLGMINANPVVHERPERAAHHHAAHALDALDVFDTVRDIKDPEHPYSLEQLSVLSQESVSVDEKLGRIQITFTPTVQHCSMATVIGLCLRLKLMQNFPPHFKLSSFSVILPFGLLCRLTLKLLQDLLLMKNQ